MKSKKILVIAAHPDDEVLGCGGAIMYHAERGDEVVVAIMGEGAAARLLTPNGKKKELVQYLASTAEQVAKFLGAKKLLKFNLPDNRLDSMDLLDVVRMVEGVIFDYEPDVIYTHFAGDLNIDHRIIFQAVLTACRPVKHIVSDILSFEIPSSTEWASFDPGKPSFSPNCFVELTEQQMTKKCEAMRLYSTEVQAYPLPRSDEGLKALAQYRGMMAGVPYCEAFQIVKQLIRR